MHKPRKDWIAFLVVVVVLVGYLLFAIASDMSEIRSFAEDRTGISLITNNRSDSGDYPFIIEAKIISETSKDLVIDIKYFLSDSINGRYDISVHPDNGDWIYSANKLRTGINHEIITVSFHPDPPQKEMSQSRLLYLYINKYVDKTYHGKVFDRKVIFPKTWSNQ